MGIMTRTVLAMCKVYLVPINLYYYYYVWALICYLGEFGQNVDMCENILRSPKVIHK